MNWGTRVIPQSSAQQRRSWVLALSAGENVLPIPDVGESGGVVREYPGHLTSQQMTKVEEAQMDCAQLPKIDGQVALQR